MYLFTERRFRLNVSVAPALEYEDLLKFPALLAWMTPRRVDIFLEYLFSTCNLEPSVIRLRPSLQDPDERILRLAVQCGAAIVTTIRETLMVPLGSASK